MSDNASSLPLREQIAPERTWNAPTVFPNRGAWEAATGEVLALLPEARKFAGKLAESPQTLADFIELADKIQRQAMKIYFYAAMESACNALDSEAVSMSDKAGGIFGQAMASMSFLDPELIAIGQTTLTTWMSQEPRLSHYTQYVDNLFRRQKHVRSAEVEQIIGMSFDPLSASENIFEMLTSADLKFADAKNSTGETLPVAQSTYDTWMDSPDRTVRQSAYESYTDGYLAFKNTIATSYINSVKRDVFYQRVRGFNSSLEASLFQNNIPVDVFQNLIDTFKKNIPTWHKYWNVRRRVLGVDSLQPYDIWAPLTKTPPVVPFEQAVEWISNGMKPLGENYVQILRQGCLQDRWVDRAVNQGKRTGAFSFGTYDTFPFIMMSYDDSMGALSTLAHELGHSMHSYLSKKNQPSVNSGYTLFAAEVASNFNQAMTRAYLREANPDTLFQIALIEEAMSNFHRYFFIMPTLARFELEVHQRVEKGMGVTADELINLCADLFAEGYGSEMNFDRERIGITWATFGHLYNAYYVYAYATGISAAHELAKGILSGKADASKRYVEFLSMGSSLYPLDALKHAGVDMTKPDAVETTFGVLADMVDRLEKLAGV
jgi:oligoendopeptidase F